MKKFSLWLVGIGIGLSLLCATAAEASHFRFAHISWTRQPETRTVTFTVTTAWRAFPAVRLNFGDGTSDITRTSSHMTQIASGTNYAVWRYTVSHTYSGDGPYTVDFGSCCRIGGIQNASGGFNFATVVDLRGGNNASPVSSAPVILQMVQGGVNNIQIPAADPDGDPLTFSLGTIAGAGGSYSIPSAGGNTLSISPSGLLTWDTSSTSIGHLWTVRVKIDSDTDASAVELDFFIQITDGSLNQAPVCDVLYNGQQVHDPIVAQVGQPVTLTVEGSDTDGDNLTITNQGLPPGATLSPTSGASPLEATFSWTPSASDAGTAHAILVTFTDPQGAQGLCTFSITVPSNRPPVAIAQDITVPLDASGNASITASQVDDGSNDPDDDPITLSLDRTEFDCDDLDNPVTVTLTVTDDNGASATAQATVTVVDVTAPVLTLLGDDPLTLECGIDTYSEPGAEATDNCDEDPAITITGADAIDAHAPGTYTVTYTATDASGNTSDPVTRTVNVVDTTPPTVALNMEVTNLWPPNHKMHRVATGSVTDECATIGSSLTLGVGVTSNQPINGLGDGNTDPDWIVNDNGDGTFDVWLRAERSGKNGERIYTLTVTASDGPNTTKAVGEVHVVHNQGKGKKNAAKPVVISSTVGEQTTHAVDVSGPLSSALDVVPDTRFAEIAQPQAFELRQNYPNPFNPETTIRYSLVEASRVRLTIYNALGQEVRVLVNAAQGPGSYSVRWDARDASGHPVTTGLYLYRLEAGAQVAVQKMILAK